MAARPRSAARTSHRCSPRTWAARTWPRQLHEPYHEFLHAERSVQVAVRRLAVACRPAERPHRRAVRPRGHRRGWSRSTVRSAPVVARMGAGTRPAGAVRPASGTHVPAGGRAVKRKCSPGVMCGSYHDVWMELHEDLILTQGIDRCSGRIVLMARFGTRSDARWSRRSTTKAPSISMPHVGWLATCRTTATTAWCSPAPPARRRRSATTSGLALFAAVIEAVTIPVHRRNRHQRHPPLGPPHQGGQGARRGRHPRGVPVLQPSVAGRHRGPHAGDRRGQRSARGRLRHPGPHRSQDHHRHAAEAVPRGAQHRRPERCRRQPRRDRGGHQLVRPPGSRSTAATTR